MRNWSVNVESFIRQNPEGYKKWKLEQQINYGLSPGEKIDGKELRKHWRNLKLDPSRRRFVKLLLTGRVDT